MDGVNHIIPDKLEYEIKTEVDFSANENINEKKFPCNLCSFRAKLPNTLQVHVEMNHIVLRYFCTVCDYNSKEKYTLKKHVKLQHGQDSDNGVDFKCGLCEHRGKETNFKEHIKHIREEHALYSFIYTNPIRIKISNNIVFRNKCEYCSSTFDKSRKAVYIKHMDRVHMGLLYECELCQYNCKYIEGIRKHFSIDVLYVQSS